MRRSFAVSVTLLIAGCATAPQAPVTETSPPPPQRQEAGSLIGMTTQQLVGRFGAPALQIREGASVKLQFRGNACVLDAYLYPSTGGALRVTHLDARLPSGTDTDQAACIAGFAAR